MVAYSPGWMRTVPRLCTICRAVRPLPAHSAGGCGSNSGSHDADASASAFASTSAKARAYVAGMDVLHFGWTFRRDHYANLVAGFSVAGRVGASLQPSLASGLYGLLDFASARRQPDFSGSRSLLERHKWDVELRIGKGELICS